MISLLVVAISASRTNAAAEPALQKVQEQKKAFEKEIEQRAAKPIQLRPLYLDAQATTPLDPRVIDAMLPFMFTQFGNPHSRTHAYGWETEKAVELARAQIASLIGADPKEIVFTSGKCIG